MKFYKRADRYKQANDDFLKKYEHVAIAERALGKALPKGAEVHHVNEDKSDNRAENLVVCPSQKYHALLHLRMKALAAGFPAHYRWCGSCKAFDDPQRMWVSKSGSRARHKNCTNKRLIEYQGQRKTASDWARAIGISRSAMCIRLQNYPLEKAMSPRMKP